MTNIPLQHKISETISIKEDKDENGLPVLELTMRFVRYRLVIDHPERTKEIIDILTKTIKKQTNVKGPVTMPKFYLDRDKGN